MSAAITAHHVTKKFGKTAALDDLSLTVEQGSITGLLGPNGAGKTTLLKAVLGLTQYEGELDVLGMDPRKGRHHLMERVCFIADVGILPRWWRVAEAVDFVEGVHPRFNRQKCETMLATTKVNKTHKIKQLSKGMLTQLHLALILAIDVELLVLDEPTLGLDILYQKEFFDRLLNDYYDSNTTILISTHQVEEVKSLLSHVVFINEGKVLLNSPMDDVEHNWLEVQVAPEQYAAAAALKPIHVRPLLGSKVMLFERVAREQLSAIGTVHVPSVSDLFIAKIKKSQEA